MPARHVCLIPARKGSKSIENKNLLELNGKSLIRIAVERALDSGIFGRIIISSDYKRYEMGINDLMESMFTKIITLGRPAELCEDGAEMIDVVKQVLNDAGGDETWVWLFQPTSPFRTTADILKIKKALESGDYESAISFSPTETHSNRIYTWTKGQAHKMRFVNYKNKQDLIDQVTRSGNFYVSKRSHLEDTKTRDFEAKPSYSYPMGNVDFERATLDELLYSMALGENIDNNRQWTLAKNHVRIGYVKV